MKKTIRLFALLLALPDLLLLAGCSGTSYGGGSGSVNYGIYASYGYPYYGYGYHDDIDINLPDRPDRPNRPDRPSIQPVPNRPSGGMGRPSGGMPRGGGGRGGRR